MGKYATPQSIEGAIGNANRLLKLDLKQAQIKEIKTHVKDFLAQKFGAWILKADNHTANDLKTLFDVITESEET